MPGIRKFVLVVVVGLSCSMMTLSAQPCSAQQTDYYLPDHSAEPVPIVPASESPTTSTDVYQNGGMTLDALQSMALASNPTIAQAQAQIDAAKGAAYQAGLRPNPNVGYVAEQIGLNGTAGELQGGFVSQEFVRGNKLALSSAKYCQRISIAETNLLAQQSRIKNDVASRFYHSLAAQRIIEIHQQMVETAADNVQTHQEMLNLGQFGEADVLQAEVELQREQLNLKRANNDLQQSWRELMAFVGSPDMQMTVLVGALDAQQPPLDWESALGQLLAESPQIIAAQQKIQHDQIAVQRERAEPIPNLTVDFTIGYNAEADQTVTGVTAGFPLPVFNKNRGTIRQAQADLNRTHAEVERLQLALRSELASQYRDYVSAWQHVQEYRQTMLPKSRSAVAKLEQSYKDRRAPWLTVLSAKRMLLDLELEQIDNQLSFQTADIAIRGNLLMGGLTEPDAPISGGHIDAVAQPR